MKTLLSISILLLGLPVLANEIQSEIHCVGQTTQTSINLQFSGFGGLPTPSAFQVDGQDTPHSLQSAGINGNVDEHRQWMNFELLLLNKTTLAPQWATLKFSIQQTNPEFNLTNLFDFHLNETYQATLTIEKKGSIIVTDKMTCTEVTTGDAAVGIKK